MPCFAGYVSNNYRDFRLALRHSFVCEFNLQIGTADEAAEAGFEQDRLI
jgi:hypothetical protein